MSERQHEKKYYMSCTQTHTHHKKSKKSKMNNNFNNFNYITPVEVCLSVSVSPTARLPAPASPCRLLLLGPFSSFSTISTAGCDDVNR